MPRPARPLLLPLCCSALLWSKKASPLVAPATHGLCARCRSQHQQGEAAHLLLQGPGDSLHPAGIPHASSERVAAPHVRRVDSLQGGGMRSCNPPPFFSRSLPGADITSGAGQRRREAASPRPGHHPLNHRPQRPSDRRRQNDWKCTGVPLSWTPDTKVV